MIDIEKLSDEELDEELERRYAAICGEHKSRMAGKTRDKE
jgi:hypothetical protein